MSLPTYAAYTSSGVEWIGSVPEHWSVQPLKRHVRLRTEKTDRRENPVALENIEGWTGRFLPTETELEGDGIAFARGDILFGKLRPYLAKTMVAAASGEAVGDFLVLRPLVAAIPEFIGYQLRSQDFISIVDGSTFGSKMPRASWDFVGAMPMPLPTAEEQQAIATFLDRETAKIDALVEEQKRLIELLKEKRQAVISQAVTKGLDPSVPMKDSGVEWLGEVPAHWALTRVKHVCSTTSGGTPNTAMQETYYTDETGFPWVRTMDLTNDLLVSVEVYITEQALKDTSCKVLPPGTVMVAMYGGDGTVGKNGLLGIHAAINQAVCGLLPSTGLVPEFMFRYMQFFRPYWMVGAESSRKDPNISQERVRNALMPLPPKSEQVAIAAFVGKECEDLDELCSQAALTVGLLQERRSALISAAVTGKIDVRGLVPQSEAAAA